MNEKKKTYLSRIEKLINECKHTENETTEKYMTSINNS